MAGIMTAAGLVLAGGAAVVLLAMASRLAAWAMFAVAALLLGAVAAARWGAGALVDAVAGPSPPFRRPAARRGARYG